MKDIKMMGRCVILAVSVTLGLQFDAFAADGSGSSSTGSFSTTSSSTTSPSSTSSSTTSPSSPAPQNSSTISGGVTATAASAELALKELDKTWHHLRESAWNCFSEVQQEDTIYVGGPNLVGGMVIPAIVPSGSLNTGTFLPPREKWLKYFASHVLFLAPQLKAEADNVALPESMLTGPSADADAVQELAELKVVAAAIPDDANKLGALCQNPPYKNMVIATAAQVLLDDLKKFDKLHKSIYKAVKDDARDAAKSASRKKQR